MLLEIVKKRKLRWSLRCGKNEGNFGKHHLAGQSRGKKTTKKARKTVAGRCTRIDLNELWREAVDRVTWKKLKNQ